MPPRLNVLVAVHLALAVVPVVIGLVPRREWGLLVTHALIAVPVSQLMLLAFWFGLGTAKPRHRLLSTSCAVAYGVWWPVAGAFLWPYSRAQPIASVLARLAVELAMGMTLALTVVALLSFGVCLLVDRIGAELRRVSDTEPAPARLQYSIAQALLITLVVAVLLGLPQAAGLVRGTQPWQFLASLATTILFLLVTLVCATWAVLVSSRIRFRVTLVLLFSIFLGIALPLSFDRDRLTGTWWILLSEALAVVLSMAILIASLLVVGSCGYRLIRKAIPPT